VATSPDGSWSGAAHEGEALPPAATAAIAADVPTNAADEAATVHAIPAEGSPPA
jgi:hypothetical protein